MTIEAELCAAVTDLEGELVALTQELVRRPSLPDHEGDAQEVVADALRRLGLEVDVLPCRYDDVRHHPAFTDDGFSPDGRVDVIGRWRGTGGNGNGNGGGRSLVLNGHIDVVPEGDERRWSRSPWSGELVDGAVHGRGSCDMKGGLAAGVIAVAAAQRVGLRPRGDVLVQSVVGEETGGLGTLTAIVHGFTADAALILEPTSLDACPIQSGALTFRMTVPGLAAHGGKKHDGVSAIDKLRVLLDAVDRLEVDRHVGHDPTTAPISVGTVRSGVWPSSVPEEAVVEGRYGVFPGEGLPAARTAFERAVAAASERDPWLAEHRPQVEWIEGQFESGRIPLDDPFLAMVKASHAEVVGDEPGVHGVPYGSDLRLFTNHAQMAAVLYGPGDVRLAHAVDEHVPVAELLTAAQTAAVLVARWCG